MGGLQEDEILRVGDRRAGNRKLGQIEPMLRLFFGAGIRIARGIAAHEEVAGRNDDHLRLTDQRAIQGCDGCFHTYECTHIGSPCQ